MVSRNRYILILLGLLLGVDDVKAATYYVDQNHRHAEDAKDNGTQSAPFATIKYAAAVAKAGDTVLIKDGVYREDIIIHHSGTEKRPIVFKAVNQHRVIVKGSDVITNWKTDRRHEYHYYIDNWRPNLFTNLQHSKPRTRRPKAFYLEQVFFKGKLLSIVWSKKDLINYSFYSDQANKRLYICLPKGENPNNGDVEVTTRSFLLREKLDDEQFFDPSEDRKGQGPRSRKGLKYVKSLMKGGKHRDHIQIIGIHFTHAMNPENLGAIGAWGGSHWSIVDNKIDWVSGAGLQIKGGQGHKILGNCILNTGSRSIVAGCKDSIFKDNVLLFSGYKDLPHGWGAAAVKFVNGNHVTFTGNYIAYINGKGLWFDVKNHDITIENNVIHHVSGSGGIMVEISDLFHIRRNFVFNCARSKRRLEQNKNRWAGAGIFIFNSSNCNVYENTLGYNEIGVSVKTGARQDAINNTIRANVLIANTRYGVSCTGKSKSTGVAAFSREANFRMDKNVYVVPNHRAILARLGPNKCRTIREIQLAADWLGTEDRYESHGVRKSMGSVENKGFRFRDLRKDYGDAGVDNELIRNIKHPTSHLHEVNPGILRFFTSLENFIHPTSLSQTTKD